MNAVWNNCNFKHCFQVKLFTQYKSSECIHTQCAAKFCSKEPDLLLLKLTLQSPVGVQVSQAAVVRHCGQREQTLPIREKWWILAQLFHWCLWRDWKQRWGRKPSRSSGLLEYNKCKACRHTKLRPPSWLGGCWWGGTWGGVQGSWNGWLVCAHRLTDDEMVLSLPAVLQTEDEWVSDLPLLETHTGIHTHTDTNKPTHTWTMNGKKWRKDLMPCCRKRISWTVVLCFWKESNQLLNTQQLLCNQITYFTTFNNYITNHKGFS